jgi:hypothetical protein
METEASDWAALIGKPHAAEIVRMASALSAPYTVKNTDRDELAEAWSDATGNDSDAFTGIPDQVDAALEHLNADKRSRGWYDREDAAREAIQEDALSIEVRSDWVALGESFTPSEFAILIATGGPAVRIRGTLGNHGEPDRAWLEVQDWFKPWTEYLGEDPAGLADACLAYARAFCWESLSH